MKYLAIAIVAALLLISIMYAKRTGEIKLGMSRAEVCKRLHLEYTDGIDTTYVNQYDVGTRATVKYKLVFRNDTLISFK